MDAGKPTIRNSQNGRFSARGTLTAKMLRKAYAPRRAPGPIPSPSLMFEDAPRVIHFDAAEFTNAKVDAVNAVIRDVSVITSGLTARGHDLEVDDVTLKQIKLCAESKGQVPVKVDHKSGAAAVCGFLTNFHIEGGKLKADWHLLQTHPNKEQILETATRMPKGVGLSAAFVGPDKPEVTKTGKKAARCVELLSVDYVTLPAANPDGMFAAKVDSSPTAMNPELLAAIQAAVSEAVNKAVAPIQEQIDLIKNPPTLEEIAQMDEAQLQKLGLTPDDVAQALDEYSQALAEQEAAANGEQVPADGTQTTQTETAATAAAAAPAAPAATAAAPAAAGAALEALQKKVTELEAKLATKETAEVKSKEEILLSEIEAKVTALTEENTRLKNIVKTTGVPVSAGVDRGGIRYFSRDASKGEFENLVQLGVEEKKLSKAKAFEFARKENPAAYDNYLIRLGVKAAPTE